MKTVLLKVTLAVMVIAGVAITKAKAEASTGTCVPADNTCYAFTGPDGVTHSTPGVLVYSTAQ
ncbi:hypothetical protein [Mucilaginibacter paludis]|uniref:Uncharacterized protein n=1 Tax=Mucilaginibacter paludis DSM 18603 TaxID=714943 RepID=H1YI31_9SPHI|nr:hypothetical protein [Mucilaginibacter paludis]EHQ25579.1 hypothetical protein Mucpa_1419 [Mucilaginibacter paludis DSM 18603]